MTREGIAIGPLFIHWYGVIIMFGVVLAAFMAEREAKKRGMDSEFIWDALPYILVAGIIGARLWHVFTPPDSMQAVGLTTSYYFQNPLEILKIWNGGLGIPGAVMAGMIAVLLYCKRHNIQFGVFGDIVAPGLALAQAIGRWGNFVNQELYGAPTNLPWAIFIEKAYRLPQYADVAYYHPLFLYESLWNLMNMAVLLWIGKKFASRLKAGDILLSYLVIYPIGRFLLEYLRLDASSIGTINANQALMAVVAAGCAIALFLRHRVDGKTQVVATELAVNGESQAAESPDEE
jgi:phosphatidylglycerol:prolipoprotein diacylglycerol transferase